MPKKPKMTDEANRPDLRQLVEQYNLTIADVAYYAGVSQDTAKAYLSDPSTKRHRSIPPNTLALVEVAAEGELEAGRSLHREFEQLGQRLKTLTQKVFGYSENDMTKIATVKTHPHTAGHKAPTKDHPLSAFDAAKEFYQLANIVDDMHVGFCMAWREPEDLRGHIRQTSDVTFTSVNDKRGD